MNLYGRKSYQEISQYCWLIKEEEQELESDEETFSDGGDIY